MEVLKNKTMELIKIIGSSRWSLFIICISVSLVILHKFSKCTKDEEIQKLESNTFSISKDKDFLSCIYSQLECYNEKAGESRKIIIETCKEISACDTLK